MRDSSPALLDVRNLFFRRDQARAPFALTAPRLRLRAGEALAVAGPSGCGKSTLLDMLGLILRPVRSDGFVFAGQDVARLWSANALDALARLRAVSLGYVLQTGGLLPFLSIGKNLSLSPSLLGRPAERAYLDHLIDVLDLGPLLAKKPHALSIGERQRASIARALAHRPALLLADEPTSSLDPVNADRVLALLLQLVEESGAALLLVSHDQERLTALNLPRLDVHVERQENGALTRFGA